jgi:hypothetical protein
MRGDESLVELVSKVEPCGNATLQGVSCVKR